MFIVSSFKYVSQTTEYVRSKTPLMLLFTAQRRIFRVIFKNLLVLPLTIFLQHHQNSVVVKYSLLPSHVWPFFVFVFVMLLVFVFVFVMLLVWLVKYNLLSQLWPSSCLPACQPPDTKAGLTSCNNQHPRLIPLSPFWYIQTMWFGQVWSSQMIFSPNFAICTKFTIYLQRNIYFTNFWRHLSLVEKFEDPSKELKLRSTVSNISA